MARLSKTKRFLKRHPFRAVVVGVLAVMIVAVVVFFIFHRGQSSPIIPSTSPAKTISGSSDKQIAATNNNSSTNAASDAAKSTGSTAPASSGIPPTEPYGDFVSNHSPGGPNPTQETSVCDTTPGASCYIQFSQGGTTKSLATQTADANGATYWNWDASILSSGSWAIKAVATLNGQAKTATDSRLLIMP